MINPNEAPEGYEVVEFEAVEFEGGERHHCDACAFKGAELIDMCFSNPCGMTSRKDRTHVYFVRRASNMSTLLYPMGSLGEEV